MSESALRGKGFETFLPLRMVRRRWSDRVKQLEVPLFPGYLFCRLDLDRRLPVLTTPGVVSIVGTGRSPAPVGEQEVDAVRRVVASGLDLEPVEYLRTGDRVTVENGPLAGLEGVLLETRQGRRLVVSVHLLQRSVAVELDRTAVRAAAAR